MPPAEFPHDPFAASTWWTGEAVDQLVRGLKLNPRMLSFSVPLELNIATSGRPTQVVIAEVDHVRATGDPRLDPHGRIEWTRSGDDGEPD